MKKSSFKVAFTVALASTIVSAISLVSNPTKVSAATIKKGPSETINGVTYYEPMNTYKDFYNHTYKPVHPQCEEITNGVYYYTYFYRVVYDIEDDQPGYPSRPDAKYGELTVDNAMPLANGSDITKYIKNAATVENYLDRLSFRYTPGYMDTRDNALKGQGTQYTFVAPDDGIVKFRWVVNELPYLITGASLFDESTGMRAEYWGADIETGIEYGGYVPYKVEKGKKYTLRFASYGGDYQQKFEMFFIKAYDNKKGQAIYEQNKLHIFTMPHEPYNYDNMIGGGAKDYTYMRMIQLPITLKQESKVSIQLQSLNYAYEGWTGAIRLMPIHNKVRMDTYKFSKDDREATEFIRLQFKMTEIGLKASTFEFTLPAGSYYIPLANNYYGRTTDVAFKYSVTPIETKKLKEPTVLKPYTGDTYLKGKCDQWAKVTATIGGKSYSTSDTSSGTYSIKVPRLKKGTSIQVKQSKPGVTSKTVTKKVVVDTFLSSTLTSIVTTTMDGKTVLSGKCYKGTTVTVKEAGKQYMDTTTTSGKYSITVPKVKSGTKVTITQSNDTGSRTNSIAPRVYDLTVFKIVYSGGKYKVSGTCKKGETVSIKVGGKTYSDKTTTSSAYLITIPPQKATQEFVITQGNTKQTVVRKMAGKTRHLLKYYKPNVTAKQNTNYVAGYSVCKGVDVIVKINGKTYKGKVDSTGKYKVKTSKLNKNTKVSVQLKSGSNISKITSVTIK